ncbi:MBG domain-containing protein [Limosilactobacillus albertensis]|uniref:KxYKxGKxW signal peptide domain-containing protein n=1 Tax=Limosilactobacillus albertensis TaxID=2759752 RepID=A0A839HBI6_9LACO|nr:MBG domain-containing protein [Limosilactobacillus albertensis]MBB1124587.1 KxYKxGKxW signal peptide domain-containing protein [Limosilactobacillus albertensis]MCD7123216.1 KxYKxGKxW signal peptide domain-containing protein [Limosilactobacillus albertensis]
MSKNDRLRKVNSENRNYKLYKAKKQWVTACATFMLAFGATAVINASADAKPALNEPEEVAASATKTPAQTGDNLQNNSTTTADKATLNSAPTSQKSADVVSTDDTAAAKTKVATDKESTNSGNSVNQPVSSDKDKSQQDSTTLAINQNGKSSNAQQLAASKAETNIAPAPYTFDNGATVVAGSNMAEIDPADLLENGAALEKAGAKITWNVLPENPTQEGSQNGTEYSGSVTVTYADGTKVNVNVSFIAEPQVQLAPNKFYYVSHVGDNVDPITTPDANGNTIFNFDDPNHSVTSGRSIGVIGPNIDVKLLTPLDTSTIGIHWAEFQFTDQNVWTNANTGEPFKIPGTSYTVKLPYVVNTIPLRTDIPVDSAGNPVINAQLADNGQVAFMNINSAGQITDNTSTLGQYFYQDYALAYALGIATNVTDWTPTAAEGTKTNSFKFTLQNLPDAPAQTVQVNYVATPKPDTIYIYNQGKAGYRVNRILNQNEVNNQITSGLEKDSIDINVGDQVYHPTSLQSSDADMDGNIFSGKYKGTMTINYSGGYNKAGQPIIFTNNTVNGLSGTSDFISQLGHWYQVTNNANPANISQAQTAVQWTNVPYHAVALAPTTSKDAEEPIAINTPYTGATEVDISAGPITFGVGSGETSLSTLVKNPAWITGWSGVSHPNPILDNNTTWPKGTTFEWLGSDGSATLVLDKAGEKKSGTVKVILPSGSSCEVPLTIVTKANVEVNSETVDYGTTLTAAQLVKNADVFPEGTVFKFVNNEPTWQIPGSYSNVQITATYKDADGKEVVTSPGTGAVAINDARGINILIGSTVPSADEVLNLPSTWPAHTATWTTPINSTATNQGEITVHYTDSGLDQIIKVYASVIPKQSAVNGQNFFTNGNLYNGQTGSIANGTTTSTVLTSNGTKEVSYSAYNKGGNPGQQATFTQGTDSYQPNYIIFGLQTNADGLVSGTQTATIRVTVPANTVGAKYDADGKYYYYELNANVNVAQKVTFEFVDQYNNNAVVGQTYSQEFIPGVQANLNFNMTIPTDPQGYGYELANGTSIPSQYTLPALTQTPAVVQVPIHQKMHFNIRFHDEDSNTDLGTVDVSGALAGNSGNDPKVVPQLKFPTGANAGDYYSVSTSGVPEGVTLAGSFWTPLTNPDATWTVPNYKWETTEAVEKALTGATMTINLKHKIKTTQEQQTRTATVNYVKAKVNADGTYTQDGSAAQSAVLDIYYSRNKYQDQVTKNITYSPWLWDTNQGQNGYHVVSGKWTSLPANWGAVVADVPTIDGYTAAVITDKSGKPANQFVYPTWNTAGANGDTDPTQASQAYTKDATAYEAQPVHTVLYIPVENHTSTVTAKFVIAGGNENGQQFAPDAQIQVFYDRTGTLNVANNKITYGNWAFDQNAGDKDTPGFHVISGNWSDAIKNGAGGGFNVIPPAGGDDYVAVTSSIHPYVAGIYFTTTQFGTPAGTTYPNATDNTWFNRNVLTTYYVPTSMVTKKVTRVVNITEPGEATRTFSTETVVLNRQVKVNNDDTGVVFDGFDGSGWNTQSWTALTNLPTHDGYTMSATKTVNGVTTPLTLVNGQIPAETVTDTTQNTTINITWGAVATATLTGNGESTYNGQAITNGELNADLKVTVTGPTANAGTYTLQNGDVEFSTDGTTWSTNMPINAGKYQVRLTTQGENGIKNKFGNNSIVWTNDGQSTITSSATYTINKLASAATMANAQAGNYEMTYNGAAPSAIDPAKFQFTAIVNGKSVVLDATGLTSSDFDWADGAAPVNVGTYQVKLNATGLAQLQKNNPNFTLTNAGDGTFTINQANASATLSGSGTRPYNGNAVSVDDLNVSNDNNNITLTLHYPKDGNSDYSTTVKLTANDFTWNTPNGQAPVNASSQAYTITINSAAVQKIIEDAVGAGQNGVSNVKFANGTITGTANYTITPLNTDATLANISEGNYTKVYDAQATNQIDPSKFQVTVMVNGKKVTLNTQSLTGNSYEWVDANGNALTENPKNVGTYYVKLTDAAFNVLQAQNPNFTLANTGLGVYTITPAEATGTLSGSNNKVYDGSAISDAQLNSNGEIKVSLNFPGVNGQTYTLKQGDYTISGNATDAGKYIVTLTQSGITNVENYIKSLAGSGQNDQSNVQFANNAISGQASFEITPSANVISVSGTQTETYKGSPYNVVYNADGTNSVTVSIAKADGNTTGALASLMNVTLDSGDFTIVNGPAVNAGSYEVQLTADGLAKVQQALGNNYSISLANSTGNLVINKYKASAEFSGDPEYTYTGTPVSSDDYLGQYSIKLNEPNNPTYKLVAGDIEFNVNGTWTTNVPVNVGQYQVRLSQQGWNNIKAINSANVEWSATASAGTGTYTINQAKVTADLSGNNSMIYNGSAATTGDLYTKGSTIKVAINGTGIANLPATFTLSDGDYTWSTEDGNAPVNAGNYTIKLTEAGINHIQDQIDQAVGQGNVALTTTADKAGTASFEIKQAVASNVQLYGNEQSTYNGQAVVFDPTNSETAKNFGFHNVENLTLPTLSTSDFTWYDAKGNEISAPTNAGTYYLKLNAAGEQAFAKANPNYTFEDKGKSTISGQITYTVNPAELVIEVAGSAWKVFNDKSAVITQDQINKGDIKLVWGNSDTEPTGLGKFNLTPDDLEVVDSQGNPALHANAGIGTDGQPIKGTPYMVRLTASGLEKVKQLTGANNYAISQSAKSGEYFIYEHKAELTLTGNQTTVYGTAMPFDPSAYKLDFTNWLNTDKPIPNLTWKDGKLLNNGKDTGLTWDAGDLYVDGYPDGGVPTNVGNYRVKISKQLTDKLRKLFPDYDFSGNVGKTTTTDSNGILSEKDVVEPSHTPASYVITPAQTTVTINGAEHIKYGENATINYGGNNGYSISITAPVHDGGVNNDAEPIYTNVTLSDGDLEFVSEPGNVGHYQVKLSAQGLKKLQDLTGSSNYDWKQASNARASFYVDQMPVTITVSGQSSVDYGSQEWLNVIGKNPSGYTLTITTENGTNLSYTAKDGDLVFNQTPGNVGTYQVELSAQGLTNIEKALGTNYAYPQVAADVTTKGTLTVNQGAVTVTLNGSDGRTYDAKETLPNTLDLSKYDVAYSAPVYSANGTVQTLTLTADDLQIVGNAINVGTYQVELSPAGQAKLEQLTGNNGANYKWTFTTKANYNITAATATAELSGSNEKTFDGSAVTTVEVNSNGQILVHLTYPGSNAQSTYTLQDGDYTWNTSDDKAPATVGNYTISLNKDAILAHLQEALNSQAGSGNVTIAADDLSGQASFNITPKEISNVTISGSDQSKTYNGQAADLDVRGLTISANGTLTDTPLVNPGIEASDFDWYDADGNKLDTAPVNVGTYEAHLKASTLAALQKANPNYMFSSVSGVINYTITPATATATIGGSDSRTYNGQTTSIADVVNNVTWGSTGFVSEQTLNTAGITADSYAWYTKDSDGNYRAMTGSPVNAGTYYLRLTDNAISQLQKDNPNYKFADNAIGGEYTYTINVVAGQATLSGQASKTYDGQAVTPAEVDSTNGNIIVHFTFPGSTAQSIYTLQDGDYTWEDGQAPVNAGTYTLKLSDQGLAHLQAAIDKYAGNGNVTLDASGLSGSAKFTIKQKTLDVTLGDNTRGTDGKIYDGQPATINTQDTNFGVFTANGLVNGEVLNTANLTSDDYEWVDADGNAASAPTNAGTYYIALNKSGLAKLQSNNPNYAISESGQFKYVISPAQAKVAITGSQESTEAKIDGANFKVNVPSGITVPAGMAYQFASGTTPDQSGVYLISLTPDSLTALEKANPNYKLNLSSTAEFTLDATLKIVFEDTQDGNKQVGKTITETGVAGSTIDNLGLAVPENYELAPDQTLPTSYTFTKALNQNLYIKLVHEISKINPVDPSTNPDPTNENWFKENGLVKDVTRTINYEGLSTEQLAQIPADQKQQTVEFTRTAKYDLVTGKIVADSEGPWTAVDGKATFAGFTPFTFAGYTANPGAVPEVTVTDKDRDRTITVTYTANEQRVNIRFVDDDKDGSQVGPTITETGVTDQTINITNVKIPAHYELAAGQTLPTSYTFKADGNNDIVIHLVEKTVTVNPVDPTTNPDPANQDWFKDNDLSKTVNRVIVDNLSSGAKTTTQSATITRTATYNEVTRKLTNYGNWTTAAWDAYQVNTPAGYTAKIIQISDGQDQVIQSIPSVNVTASTQPVRISITYTANAQTGKISYVDSDGQGIGQTTINGKTGEPVKVTPQVPAGWKIVPGQDIPATVTATANGIPAVTVKVEHSTITVTPDTPEKDIPSGKVPGDPSKNYEKMENLTAKPTRTIVVTSPSGEKTTITQAVSFTRTATFDEVTGEISYSDWTSAQSAEWSAYTAPEVAGYTASQAVTAQPVTPTTKNETVNISYAANTQIGKIIYRDSTGKEIGQTSLTAKTGETIKITPVVPTNWQIAPGQDIPTVVTATANGIPAVVITVEPQTETVQEHKTVTRTIIEHLPSGDKKVVQTVKLTGTGTKNLVNGKVTALKWTTGQFAAFTPETVPGYTTNMSIVPIENITFESADSTVEITYSKIPTPTDSQQVIQYQDENETIISTETIKGQAGTEVAFNPQIPTNWQAVNAVPSTIKIAGGTTVILIKPQVEAVQEHKTVTRTIIEHLPSGNKKVVQTVELTGDGTKNLVTGEVSNLKWNSGKFAAFTPETVAGYTASPAVIAVEPVTVDTNNQTVDVAYTANEQTGKIIYRDQNGNEIGQTILTGRTGETIAVTPDLPAGWQPVTGQDVPATAVVTANGISTINITVEHKTIVIVPGQEAPTGQVPGNPDTTYEHMDALTNGITRTIKVDNPNGQQQIVTQTVEFTRTAIFDEVTGQVTYSAWQPTGDTSWPAYKVPSVVGYTADCQDIPAETVAPGMSDQSITITYTKDAQPVEPTTPTQPEKPNQPNKPATPPHKPSMPAQPAVPTPGENLVSGNNHEKAVVPDQVVNDHIANRHSISTQLQQSSQMNKQRVKKLPQTGNATNKAAVTLGFAFATLASIFGLAGMRRKRRTK